MPTQGSENILKKSVGPTCILILHLRVISLKLVILHVPCTKILGLRVAVHPDDNVTEI